MDGILAQVGELSATLGGEIAKLSNRVEELGQEFKKGAAERSTSGEGKKMEQNPQPKLTKNIPKVVPRMEPQVKKGNKVEQPTGFYQGMGLNPKGTMRKTTFQGSEAAVSSSSLSRRVREKGIAPPM